MNSNNTPVTIEIPHSAHEATKRVFKEVAKEVWDRLITAKKNLADVEAEWNGLKPALNKLGLNLSEEVQQYENFGHQFNVPVIENYNSSWSWAKKAEYILTKEGKALSAQAIIDRLIGKYEPKLNRNLAQNSLPATLSADAKRGRFSKIETAAGNLYFLANS